jgi:hypothetical protein
LRRLDAKKMPPEVHCARDDLLQYLENNVHRMNYPDYLRQGWQMASGAVESARKTVVNHGLCQGGMRCAGKGSDAVVHLRALYRSDQDQWEAFWATAA